MNQLKGVIFGWDNVLVALGACEPQLPILQETCKLVRFLRDNGVEILVATNNQYTVSDGETGKTTPAKEYFEKAWEIKIDWHVCGQSGKAGKQSHAGFQEILGKKGWKPNNVVYVGNSRADMQAAVNNKVLLLTAKWYQDTAETTEYGFQFDDAKGVARFIDVFCLRKHYWYYHINDGSVQVFTLAPLNTYYDLNKYHCEDFLYNVKNQYAQDDEFWAKFLCTSMYFSGVYEQVKFITAYPKHEQDQYQDILVLPMDTFAKSFSQKRYIPDLIKRHTTALKSQFHRRAVTHGTQLETICLNSRPTKLVKGRVEQIEFPVKRGETVLVIDDVCTKGMSFEAARHYFAKLGISVISVAFLKTPTHDYQSLSSINLLSSPFRKNERVQFTLGKSYAYHQHIVDANAPADLTERLKRYQNWNWPV